MPNQGTGAVNGTFNEVLIPSYEHVSYYLRSEEMHENVERGGSVEIEKSDAPVSVWMLL